jgi:hypothetical protein
VGETDAFVLHDSRDVPEHRMHTSVVSIYDTTVMFGGMVTSPDLT